jgi:hypothetical protein
LENIAYQTDEIAPYFARNRIAWQQFYESERASYVVLNASVLMQQLIDFNPSDIAAYGYWGEPSATAVTPYRRLCFAAFSIRRRQTDEGGALRCHLSLPPEICDILESPLG